MTEAEWLTSDDPTPLYRYLHREAPPSPRQKWLLTVAFSWLFGDAISPQLTAILAEMEEIADGTNPEAEPADLTERTEQIEGQIEDGPHRRAAEAVLWAITPTSADQPLTGVPSITF